ncbi:MAG: DUF6242 domain-containing protein [Paludibacter sp.]|nr:DUF6242 domain-containing protein [Bacteroidales bacterium]MCM1068442.1 DUF6242 domain-containing protein [Prevotella sp.]MCM1353396.1 DUF6242 domain-containing protein [Bacteroides sp.]MCM1442557.1 DUF6242 domain-containing protein [Muribaculum sp.]MCM1481402.1 DUF6242 domain-containing protein [Paludibacter sp.]
MKRLFTYFIPVLLLGLGACSAGTGTTPVTVSDDATVASLTFVANDSFPGLAKAVFLVEDRIDTGVIYNVDSLLFGTRVDSVIPTFRFNQTPGAAVLYTATDTIPLSGRDTVDFSNNPTLLHVIASDYVSDKWYKIYVNVHQVDPELYVWERLANNVFPAIGTEQKAVWHNGMICLYVNDGLTNRLYESNDGISWSNSEVNGLPVNCQVRNIIEADNQLYYAESSMLYMSQDAIEWTACDFTTADFSFVNMLYSFNDSVWAIVRTNDETYRLAATIDGQEWVLHEVLPANFPVSDYAALCFRSASNRRRAMIVGGFDAEGNTLNTRWNVEAAPGGEYHWSNFSIEQPDFISLTGVSVIWYNQRFLMFGGTDGNNELGAYTMLESMDEGMNWYVPDSAHNVLPQSYQPRSKQSVLVDSNNNIYIIGGQSRTEAFSDVYRGRLNSIDW